LPDDRLDLEFEEIGASGRRWTRDEKVDALLADDQPVEDVEAENV